MSVPWKPDKSQLDEADKKLLADVERYGWHCLHIRGLVGESTLPYWSFSIGLFQTWQHPELVVFGLEQEQAHAVLGHLVDRIKTGERFSSGQDYSDILDGYLCRFIVVDPRWYSDFFGYAQWFYETADGFPALQLLLPDKEGRYPWDDGYAITKGMQPILSEAAPE